MLILLMTSIMIQYDDDKEDKDKDNDEEEEDDDDWDRVWEVELPPGSLSYQSQYTPPGRQIMTVDSLYNCSLVSVTKIATGKTSLAFTFNTW